ncbi:hypothetical protein H9P43_002485 [Blastocladiella emersonii ATCC 22665]|nr:hypothetical protein H9P43_002485 [Blastocladiella emersonii ATCC 22665]
MKLSILNLLVLALLASAATASVDVTPGTWTPFQYYDEGKEFGDFSVTLPQDGHLVVTDTHCVGDTLVPIVDGVKYAFDSATAHYEASGKSCDRPITDPDEARHSGRYSWSAYPLAAGTHSIKFFTTKSPYWGGEAEFKVAPGAFVSEKPKQQFIVLADAKVANVDEAQATCGAKGARLAEITGTNFKDAQDSARGSGVLTMPETGGADQVFVASWEGNNYGGDNLALYVSQTGATINLADANPHFPLCETTAGAIPDFTVQATELKVGTLDGLAVVVPAGPNSDYAAKCALVGKVPAILYGGQNAKYEEASRIVFEALGPMAQVWLRGWDTDQENMSMTLTVGAVSGPGAVTIAGSNRPRAYLCHNGKETKPVGHYDTTETAANGGGAPAPADGTGVVVKARRSEL